MAVRERSKRVGEVRKAAGMAKNGAGKAQKAVL